MPPKLAGASIVALRGIGAVTGTKVKLPPTWEELLELASERVLQGSPVGSLFDKDGRLLEDMATVVRSSIELIYVGAGDERFSPPATGNNDGIVSQIRSTPPEGLKRSGFKKQPAEEEKPKSPAVEVSRRSMIKIQRKAYLSSFHLDQISDINTLSQTFSAQVVPLPPSAQALAVHAVGSSHALVIAALNSRRPRAHS